MKRLYFTFLLLTLTCLFAYSQVDVVFTVDLSNETVDPAGAFIAGGHNGWTNGAMSDNGDGTWSATISLNAGDTLEYKFKNGDGDWEDLGAAGCVAGNGNRLYYVPATNDTLGTVCFNSCYACGIEGIQLTVDMSNETIDSAVFIAGEHNGWTNGHMTDNGDGTWSTFIGVATGDTSNYKFKNGVNGWEAFDGDCLSGGAGSDRFVVGPTADSTAATVCFNSCEACTTGGGPVDITFTVDMSNETVDAEGVRLAGSPTGWADTLMTDNADGTWSVTLELTGGETVLYKFKNGSMVWENDPGPCKVGNDNNRQLIVPEMSDSLDAVCFNSCFGCDEIGVILTVDMQFETVSSEGVFLAGAHNGWTDGTMTDNGDGTWTGYFGGMPGDTAEYKFKNGSGVWESFDGDCLIDGNGSNRFVAVPMMGDTTVPAVCFNMCEACVILDSVEVTFRVDMTEETVSVDGVWLANSDAFNDTLMMNMGDSIYAITLLLKAGEEVEYNFRNGLLGFENIIGLPCGEGGLIGNKRVLNVPGFHTVLDAVCFEKCDVCFDPTSVSTAALSNSCMNADGTVTIVFDESQNCDSAPGDLAGLAEIGFHSSGNMWADVIDWNAPTAVSAVNDGNDVFSVTIDPATYYSMDINDIERIMMVFNQGITNPDDEWGSEGKDQDLDEDGSCDDMRLILADLPMCTFDPTTTTSPALKTAGSCYDPTNELVRVRFDDALNCSSAPGELAGMGEIGFHSGADAFNDVVMWNDPGAQTAVNDGNDVFEVIIDPVSYYAGVNNFGDLENIHMVFNQGPSDPDNPWDSEGKDEDAGNCVNLRLIISDIPTCDLTNTIDRELENSLVAIPNPFDSRTVVTFSNPNLDAYEVTLFSLTGQQMRTFHNVNGTTLEIDRNGLPAGMYFLNFRDDDGKIATLKLVVK